MKKSYDFRNGFIEGMVCAMNAIYLDKLDYDKMVDFLYFVSCWKNRDRSGIPSVEDFRKEMEKMKVTHE